MVMDRRDKIDYIKRVICPLLDLSQELDIQACLLAIARYRHGKPQIVPMQPAFVNEYGHLFINGEHCGQITNKISRPCYTEEGAHYEALCIKDIDD